MAAYKAKVEAAAAGDTPEVAEAEEPDLSAFGAPTEEQADFGAFTARLRRAPDQCLRYTYAAASEPLWASRRRRPPVGAVPACEACGSARRFEFQVMPQALAFLGVDSLDADAPDWATLAVYTCSAHCAPAAPATESGVLADPPATTHATARAAVGHAARLKGLQARPDLNGAACVVLGWQEEGGRWAVECASGERIRVRSANLFLEQDDSAAAVHHAAGGYAEEYVWIQTSDG